MAQTIQIANAIYPDVPSIVCNKQGGGTVSFVDVSQTTAVASDVASGKIFYLADGTQGVGTSSGGGGGTSLADLCNGNITRLDDDNVTSFLISLRATSWNLQTIFLKNLETMSVGYCFANTKIKTVVLPSLKYGTSASYFFSGASSLTKIDLGPKYSTESVGLRGGTFNGASALNTLILRKSSAIVPLQNINAFGNTPFASGKAGGTLYVPSALISSYQSANNWSTILGYTNNQIKSIESTHTDPNAPIDLTLYYADGTPIT